MQQKQERPGDITTQAIRWQRARPLQHVEGERLHREHVVWSRNLNFLPGKEKRPSHSPPVRDKALFVGIVIIFMSCIPWLFSSFFFFINMGYTRSCYLSISALMVLVVSVQVMRERDPWVWGFGFRVWIHRNSAPFICTSVSRVWKTTQKSIRCHLVMLKSLILIQIFSEGTWKMSKNCQLSKYLLVIMLSTSKFPLFLSVLSAEQNAGMLCWFLTNKLALCFLKEWYIIESIYWVNNCLRIVLMTYSTTSHEIRLKVLQLNHISGFEFFHRHTRIIKEITLYLLCLRKYKDICPTLSSF